MLKKINPTCKLIGILIPIILLAFLYNFWFNYAVVGVCVVLLLCSKVNWRAAGKLLIPIFILAVGMYATGYTFYAGSNIGIGEGQAALQTDSSVQNGLLLSGRTLAFAFMGLLFVLTTDITALVRSFEQQLHMPPKFIYGIMASLQTLPNMNHEYKKTKAAFRARGIEPFALSPALLTSLTVKAVRWSEAMAAAMESQGFDDEIKRAYYRKIELKPSDILFPFLSGGIFLIGWFCFGWL